LLLDAARREAGRDFDTVAAIVGEASQDLRFNQRLLEAALENMSQGISVVDRELRLVAWNRRYAELFGYPESLLRVGVPVAELVRYNLRQRGNASSIEEDVDKRVRHMRAGTPYVSERIFPDESVVEGMVIAGMVIEIRGNPMPGGGFVATFTDVTAFRRAEAELIRSNETLEQRVADRTARLDQARADAERANDAKSRFLAAIGHDLLQPLHAAQLFTDALIEQLPADAQRGTAQQIRGALDSTGDLLAGLLDMSRLEAGGLVPQPRAFPLADVLEPLASEFRALAAERGLRFRYRATRAWVHTDPQLLRRVLQNFLANAVRYTERGGVLIGARRIGRDQLSFEVRDSGKGIPHEYQARIFEEYFQLENPERHRDKGLGLGLAIVSRLLQLLGSSVQVRSQPGRGSCFSFQFARCEAAPSQPVVTAAANFMLPLENALVAFIDDDETILAAMVEVFDHWNVALAAGEDAEQVRDELQALGRAPDLILCDYRLRDGHTGIEAVQLLRDAFGAQIPAALLTGDTAPETIQEIQAVDLPVLHKPLKPAKLRAFLSHLLTETASPLNSSKPTEP
jgi:PAS domain S-box-containing protein